MNTKHFFAGIIWVGLAAPAVAQDHSVAMNAITAQGVGEKIGEIVISEGSGGLTFKVNLKGIEDGDHGFHVHEKGNCEPGMKDGKAAAGIAAGGHYDPGSKKSHKGPDMDGHTGDLPKLTATSKTIAETIVASKLKYADIAGKALMLHEGGDNYSDNPENGGGKGRIACGVAPK